MCPAGDAHPPERAFPDAAAATALAGLVAAGPYLPWGAGTMRLGGLVAVCNDVVLGRRRCLVELGSGTSTLLLHRLLRSTWPDGGYRQVVVEHDAAWARWVAARLAEEGAGTTTTVLHVPLTTGAGAEPDLRWYDAGRLGEGLDAALGGEEVDLLLVDGPPADTPMTVLARWPALPVLAARLAPGATVVLDDAERPGEQEVLRRWERDHGLAVERRSASAGVALCRVRGATEAPGHG